MTQQEHRVQEQSAIRLKPIISYPREAKVGERYLFTIDVQLAEDSPWPYREEEFEISFILETTPFFTHEPLGEHEPGLVLHRYGGTYGAAEYLLTAAKKTVAPGKIKVTLLNGWGLPIAQLELDCEVKKDVQTEEKRTKRTFEDVPETPTAFIPDPLSAADKLLGDDEQRELIARQLSMVGWDIRDADTLLEEAQFLFNMDAVRFNRDTTARMIVPIGNIALRGYPSAGNDYLLIINREIVGFVKVYIGEKQLPGEVDSIALPDAITNTQRSNLKSMDFRIISVQLKQVIPFMYHTTGNETTFRSYLEPDIHSRNVYTFHKPVTLDIWLDETFLLPRNLNLLRDRLLRMPALEQGSLFDYQYEALQCIEKSLAEGHPRTLIQLETGRGKTYVATRCVQRLLEHARVKHIFYVVDIDLAKKYALDAFNSYILSDQSPDSYYDGENRFTLRYTVKVISNEKLDPSVHIYIGTLEDLYTLYASGREGQNLPPPIHNKPSISTDPSRKDYNTDLPIEYFDVIVLAECENINYQFWQPLLDYFDAFYIGIAASISNDVQRFFHNHLVYPPLADLPEKAQEKTGTTSSLSQQELMAHMRNVQRLLKPYVGVFHDTDHLSELPWLLLLKYLDDFERTQKALFADSYTPIIEQGYRWHDWVVAEKMLDRRNDTELLNFVNTNLIPYLRGLSGENARDIRSIVSVIFRSVHNPVRSGSIMREIVSQLNSINFNSPDDTRMIALYYESLLKDLHDSPGNSGTFYTPRPIVRFMIDCLKPQLDESLLDPACGTAGFLVETYERLAGRVRTTEQRKALQDNLVGIEQQPMPYLLAIMNMLLHGIEAPNIIERNALLTDIQLLQDNDYVDIIATNPPFGGMEDITTINSPDDSSFSGYNNLPASLRHIAEATQLFIQYCMPILKRPGGRCGIVVPDSFLSQAGTAAETRRLLLTNFNLYTIVHLSGGIFAPYSSTSTSLLFFATSEDQGNSVTNPCTKEVWYYAIPLPEGQRRYTKKRPLQYEAFHDCLLWWDQRVENEHAWKVSIEELFANDCNLDVKRGSHPSG